MREPSSTSGYSTLMHILKVQQFTFTPLIFSETGGVAKQSTTFYKRPPSLLTSGNTPTVQHLSCLLLFSLLRSAIQCIRGACSFCSNASRSPTVYTIYIHPAPFVRDAIFPHCMLVHGSCNHCCSSDKTSKIETDY